MAAPIHNIGDQDDQGSQLPQFPHMPPQTEADMMENLDTLQVPASSDAGHMIAQIKSSGSSFENLHLFAHCLQSGVLCPELPPGARTAIAGALGSIFPLKPSSDMSATLYTAISHPLFAHWNQGDVRDLHTLKDYVGQLSENKSAPLPEISNPGLKNALCQLAGPDHAHTSQSALPSPHTLGSKPPPYTPPNVSPPKPEYAFREVRYWSTEGTAPPKIILSLEMIFNSMMQAKPPTTLPNPSLQAYAMMVVDTIPASDTVDRQTLLVICGVPHGKWMLSSSANIPEVLQQALKWLPDGAFSSTVYQYVKQLATQCTSVPNLQAWLKANPPPSSAPNLAACLEQMGLYDPNAPASSIDDALSRAETVEASYNGKASDLKTLINILKDMQTKNLPMSVLQGFGALLDAEGKMPPELKLAFEEITGTPSGHWTIPTSNEVGFLQAVISEVVQAGDFLDSTSLSYFETLLPQLDTSPPPNLGELSYWFGRNAAPPNYITSFLEACGIMTTYPPTSPPQTVQQALTYCLYYLKANPPNPYILNLCHTLEGMNPQEKIVGSGLEGYAATIEAAAKAGGVVDIPPLFETLTDTMGGQWTPPTSDQAAYLQSVFNLLGGAGNLLSSTDLSFIQTMQSFLSSNNPSSDDITAWLEINMPSSSDLISLFSQMDLLPTWPPTSSPSTVGQALDEAHYWLTKDPQDATLINAFINALETLDPNSAISGSALQAFAATLNAHLSPPNTILETLSDTQANWSPPQTNQLAYLQSLLTMLSGASGTLSSDTLEFVNHMLHFLSKGTPSTQDIDSWLEKYPCPDSKLEGVLKTIGYSVQWPPTSTPETTGQALIEAKYWLTLNPKNPNYIEDLITALESLPPDEQLNKSGIAPYAAMIIHYEGGDNIDPIYETLTGYPGTPPDHDQILYAKSFMALMLKATAKIIPNSELPFMHNFYTFLTTGDPTLTDVHNWLAKNPCPDSQLEKILKNLNLTQ
ncbi:MAG: hypothetical protein SP1CHLAM54_14400 [Chlamydiia bacterium]|nr:hypothetical protein [Chlamydiia bacterium]MCH9616332.1 hypothetical protein [Chlamydiia bacterium]MCH9629682.1 hypothetical protein [Chlamydiia bacterium]